MIVTFFGHKDATETKEISSKLANILRRLIAEGADTFLLGGYGRFDSFAARTVKNIQKEFPHIRSTLVIPYPDFKFSPDLYSDSVYPPLENVPRKFAISHRNKWIVNNADVIISYVSHNWGGAAAATRYAKRRKKRVISISDDYS